MKYTVEAFEKETELLAFEMDLPDGCDAQLASIMVWAAPQRGDEGYDLNPHQLEAIELLAGRRFDDSEYQFQLTCNVA